MNIKQVKQGQKIVERLTMLDNEINSIEKLAIHIASFPKSEIEFSISATEVPESKKVDVFDGDGFIKKEFKGDCVSDNCKSENPYSQVSNVFTFTFDYGTSKKSEPEVPKKKYDSKIVDIEALEILGILIGRKQQEREFLLKQLESL